VLKYGIECSPRSVPYTSMVIGAALRWAIFQVSPSRRKVILTRNDIGTISWLSATALRFEAIAR